MSPSFCLAEMSKFGKGRKALPFAEDDELAITVVAKTHPRGFMAEARRTAKDPLPERDPKRLKPSDLSALVVKRS